MMNGISRIMHKGWLSLANLSLEKKLILTFVFLLTLPITYVSYLSAHSTFNSVLQNATNNAIQMADHASNSIDRYVADLKRSTILPLYNSDVQYYLEQEQTDWGKNVSINMFLSYLIHTKDEIAAVYLVDSFNHIFFNKRPYITDLSTADQLNSWRSLLDKEQRARPVLMGRHQIWINGNEPKAVFSVLRMIKSARTLQNIGIIVFDVDIELFKDITNPMDQVTQGSSLILDEQGELVYASGDPSTVNARKIELLSKKEGQPSGSFESDIDENSYLTVYYVSEQTGWTTSAAIPLDKILSKVKQNSAALIITTLILLSIALIVATYFSHALTKPLKSMVRYMKQVQHGNLDVWITTRYEDEIGMMGSHFNRMILRIKELLREIKVTEKRKKAADIRALQSQINPHFIYNTLESIRMLAEDNDDPRIAKLTYLLGTQLRYSIVRSEEIVMIAQELEHVSNYFNLLSIRFPNKFNLVLDVPEPFLELPVLKLVFQPIVENALFHGLERKPDGGTVIISAWQNQEHVIFQVKDDGVGMDEQTLIALNRSLIHAEPGETFGIGIRNVNERIRLHYGDDCGLQVKSEQGMGTCVMMRIKNEIYEVQE